MSQSSPLQVGIIGAGWWATFAHIPAILAHPGARLLAVQCRSQKKADKVARDFDVPHALTSVEALLELPGLDAVVIATTPNMHYAQAKTALELGKHVLLEKPMTFTAAEARELCEIAEARGVQLLISCPWHFTAHGMAAREMIRAGRLGDIRMLSILMTNPLDKLLTGVNTAPTHGMDNIYVEPNLGSYNDPNIAGGGQIYCQVSHAASYITFLTGLRSREVFAKFDFAGSSNDIYDALTLTLENGALVSLASTAATPLTERNYEVRVFGTRGILLLELWKGTCEFIPFEGDRECLPNLPENEIYPERAPARNLIDAALGIAPNGSDGLLGLASMEVIEAACQSARSGQPVKIDPPSPGLSPLAHGGKTLTGETQKIMIRKAFIMQVFPEQVEEYEKCHNPIWQELSDLFTRQGVHNYSIHLDEVTHTLFGYVEIEDEARWAAIAETAVNRRWWEHMKPLMKYNDDGTPWSRGLREVFHIN